LEIRAGTELYSNIKINVTERGCVDVIWIDLSLVKTDCRLLW
jgi:hypothetical protein